MCCKAEWWVVFEVGSVEPHIADAPRLLFLQCRPFVSSHDDPVSAPRAVPTPYPRLDSGLQSFSFAELEQAAILSGVGRAENRAERLYHHLTDPGSPIARRRMCSFLLYMTRRNDQWCSVQRRSVPRQS